MYPNISHYIERIPRKNWKKISRMEEEYFFDKPTRKVAFHHFDVDI